MRQWTPMDILGAVINEAVDTYGHIWATINGSMDTQVLSLMGLWTSMDMLPLMGPWTCLGYH